MFDTVWPGILSELLTYSAQAVGIPHPHLQEPNTQDWSIVRDYFASAPSVDSARLLFLRCLMAEYLRGVLLKYQHPRANEVPPAQPNLPSVATTIAALQQIDFRSLFEAQAPALYRDLTQPALRNLLTAYLRSLLAPDRRVVDLATTRLDAPDLVDSLLSTVYPPDVQDESGKIRTDPELAALLAWLTISNPAGPVIDPCCGDGALLSAAYQFLVDHGTAFPDALASLTGLEADPLALRLAEVRLALKQTAALRPEPPLALTYGDMFAHPAAIRRATVVLMNPPFKRYEDQDQRPVPPGLRTHYNQAIRAIDGHRPTTTGGQSNLFHSYVEFVIKTARPNAAIGIVLDNKWYHNGYGAVLRRLLLERCQILGLIEYPHWAFFTNWTIATSLLVAKKTAHIDPEHNVKFVRARTDPRSVDLRVISHAFHDGGDWPIDWRCREIPQRELTFNESWKKYFGAELDRDFRLADWPFLPDVFEGSRRGSLEKEGGGVEVYEFPFDRTNYGPRRRAKPDGTGFQTIKATPLTNAENSTLRNLASRVPATYRGWSLRNADQAEHFELTPSDVQKDQTLEPPRLRALHGQFHGDRTPWTAEHEQALSGMREHPRVGPFIAAVEQTVGLDETVLERKKIWNVLREPIAGELIVPRKTRVGHRVHVNPFAFEAAGRQVRLSSNFIGYRSCTATDPDSGLERPAATRLIAAFLVSSFGQLQFEMEGYNREGALSIEDFHLGRIRVFDPRWIRPECRQAILNAFAALPYPIPANRRSSEQTERNALDALFAAEIANRYPQFDAGELVSDVHDALDEWLEARQP
ncbi:MAG: N-6 DNA methylase [Bryobacteraceae bacterium]